MKRPKLDPKIIETARRLLEEHKYDKRYIPIDERDVLEAVVALGT